MKWLTKEEGAVVGVGEVTLGRCTSCTNSPNPRPRPHPAEPTAFNSYCRQKLQYECRTSWSSL